MTNEDPLSDHTELFKQYCDNPRLQEVAFGYAVWGNPSDLRMQCHLSVEDLNLIDCAAVSEKAMCPHFKL
jgi:hypothetical protein